MVKAENKIKRSFSMPTQPRDFDERKSLARSEEKERLFSTNDIDQIEEIDEFMDQQENDNNNGTLDQNDITIESHNLENNGISLNEFKVFQAPSIQDKLYNSPCVYQGSNPFTFNGRVIDQDGNQNINFIKIPQRSRQYLKDLVTTMVEQKWSYTIILFISSFFAVWYFCAAIWYLIAYAHGDLSYDVETGEKLTEGEQTCANGVETFTGFFIYTMETHSSIGFGERHPTDECPEGVFFFAAQLILYIGVEGMLVSIVYMKIAKPSRKIAKPKFSKRAVICLRNGKHCLIMRICDRESQQTIGSKITLYLLQNRRTLEGEFLQKSQTELKLDDDGTQFLLWPTTICHVIDKSSPFYNYRAEDFASKDYEIVVSCTGTSASTGQFTECITSYLANEVHWGERFVNIIDYDWRKNEHVVDYDNFDTTVSVGMPIYSAQELRNIVKNAKRKARTA